MSSGSKKDLYEILQVKRDCSESELKKAFHQAALRYHPDKNPTNREESEQKFKEIQNAYQILSNPDSRRMYDVTGLADESPFDLDLQNLFSSLFTGPIPQASPTVFTFFTTVPTDGPSMFTNSFMKGFQMGMEDSLPGFDWMDLMEPFVDQAKGFFDEKKEKEKSKKNKKKIEAREFDIHVPFEDVYRGKERTIEIDVKVIGKDGKEREERKEHRFDVSKERIEIMKGGDEDHSSKPTLYQSCIFYIHPKKHKMYERVDSKTGEVRGQIEVDWKVYQEGGKVRFSSPNGKEWWEITIDSFENRPDHSALLLKGCGCIVHENRGDLYLYMKPVKKLEMVMNDWIVKEKDFEYSIPDSDK